MKRSLLFFYFNNMPENIFRWVVVLGIGLSFMYGIERDARLENKISELKVDLNKLTLEDYLENVEVEKSTTTEPEYGILRDR